MAQNRNNTDQDLAGLIEYVAKSLVDDPTQVKVKERNSSNATVIELKVAQPDTGRIIGKGGRVANALRSLLRVAEAENRGRRIILKIQ
ncbi:MAG: KH domain-containing protein [Pleurocapsa minor GSE-CHR-MK-17-07R]|jgi:predicted RNA-binding protein YlqC (UPF0109 family)|nr:KH domain-containing protein [Pleurocapsa minor GSE-CHR-MK 17-07R]